MTASTVINTENRQKITDNRQKITENRKKITENRQKITDIHRRAVTLEQQLSLQEHLSIGITNHTSRDVRTDTLRRYVSSGAREELGYTCRAERERRRIYVRPDGSRRSSQRSEDVKMTSK